MTTQQAVTRARLQGLAFLVGTTGAIAAMFVFAMVGLPLFAGLSFVTGMILAGYAEYLFWDAKEWGKL